MKSKEVLYRGRFCPLKYICLGKVNFWVIRIHWNSTSEHQCSSSAKPVNSGMSDSFYTACMGHSVCQTDLSLHLQWSWSPAPRPSHASNLSQRHPSLLHSKWREQNALKYFREDKGISSAPCKWTCGLWLSDLYFSLIFVHAYIWKSILLVINTKTSCVWVYCHFIFNHFSFNSFSRCTLNGSYVG